MSKWLTAFQAPLHFMKEATACCVLCNIDPAEHAGLCPSCTQDLPWLKTRVQRQELQIWAACQYQFPIDRMLQQFKYEAALHYLEPLAHCLLQARRPLVDAIVPMPISASRLNERGYNQALLLAEIVADHYKLPIWQPILRQHRQQQKGLDRLERLENLQLSFAPRAQQTKRYKRVLVIDDVVTTGSSLYFLQQQLKDLGCTQIDFYCVAAAM